MNYYERPTELHEQANAEAMTVFAERMNQFKGFCGVIHNVENNLSTIGNDAFKAALLSPGRVVQADDGTEWQHGVDLMKNCTFGDFFLFHLLARYCLIYINFIEWKRFFIIFKRVRLARRETPNSSTKSSTESL